MENRETVCPRHATTAEMSPEGDVIRGVHCAWQGCDEHLRAMLSSEDASWLVGERPVITDRWMDRMFERFVERATA